jgi:glycosyltransferase involved in cell wall biosynthesis
MSPLPRKACCVHCGRDLRTSVTRTSQSCFQSSLEIAKPTFMTTAFAPPSPESCSRSANTVARLPLTVIVAVRNEEVNMQACLESLSQAQHVIVVDSNSTDRTAAHATDFGAEVIQYERQPGGLKKRQWALDTIPFTTPWVMLVDADERVPEQLWAEIRVELSSVHAASGYLIEKGFWFLGRKFRFGGFSHSAVLLFQRGKGRFEQLDHDANSTLDMEVHERMIVDGEIRRLKTPLIHNDFKGLTAYLDRHNHYATWEALVRRQFLTTGRWGESAIQARLFGNVQERRRFLKQLACRLPGEPILWFLYHYVLRLGLLEGRRGLIASLIRAQYIANVRAKMFEFRTFSN